MTHHQDTVQYNPSGQPTMFSQVQQHSYEQAVEKLISNLRGDVILPGDAAYETERKVWNGLYDYYPAAIVRCTDAEDVRIAVNFARELAMPLSVRSGGHSLSGYGSNDGGLVIDLANLMIHLNGIGDANHLQAMGVPVVADLPGVGQNLQDHLLVCVVQQSTKENSKL